MFAPFSEIRNTRTGQIWGRSESWNGQFTEDGQTPTGDDKQLNICRGEVLG